MNSIFITGATGHLGQELTQALLNAGVEKLFVLTRNASAITCQNEKVIPIVGDITLPNLGLSLQTIEMLQRQQISHVVHCAAETSLKKSRQDLWEINVEGTRNVINTLRLFSQGNCCFVHVSTAYVAGQQQGLVKEEGPLGKRFYTHYEESKAEAEKIVRKSGLKYLILRPGMIVGNSQTGYTRNFNTIYYVVKLLLQGKMRILPVSARQTVNIIPVDLVARQTVQLLSCPQAIGKTFHLTLPHHQLPTVGELLSATCQWAEENLNVHIKGVKCVPLPWLRKFGGTYKSGGIGHNSVMNNLRALLPYFCDDHVFDRTNTDAYTQPEDSDWRKWLPHMLEFACRHNFMQLTSRSIFEQAMVRRESSHYPITYYNIGAQGLEEVTGQTMNAMVRNIVGLLQARGIKPGDRVAVTGINCTEQAAIDCAIGLVGGVSVPIYYTTPATEVAELLQRSGATLFFVGDERMVQQLKQVDLGISIITFANATELIEGDSLRSLINELPPVMPISHEGWDGHSLATIRYTSGTTGTPNGVMFSFNQLKWMGEVLTNLLPWRDRNREMRYPSFLPIGPYERSPTPQVPATGHRDSQCLWADRSATHYNQPVGEE